MLVKSFFTLHGKATTCHDTVRLSLDKYNSSIQLNRLYGENGFSCVKIGELCLRCRELVVQSPRCPCKQHV